MNIMNQENSEKLWKLPLYKIYTDDEDVNLITKIVKLKTYPKMQMKTSPKVIIMTDF